MPAPQCLILLSADFRGLPSIFKHAICQHSGCVLNAFESQTQVVCLVQAFGECICVLLELTQTLVPFFSEVIQFPPCVCPIHPLQSQLCSLFCELIVVFFQQLTRLLGHC